MRGTIRLLSGPETLANLPKSRKCVNPPRSFAVDFFGLIQNLRVLLPGSFVPINIHPDNLECFHRLLLDVYPVTGEFLSRRLDYSI